MATDYEILITLEDIFNADSRTKKYTIQGAEDPDNVPTPEICPIVNLLPIAKPRELARMSTTPYTANLMFEVILWEMSAGDFKNAFKLMSKMEENVFQVLLKNKNVSNTVLTSVIGETLYENMYYESCFYIKAVIPFVIEKDQ